MIIGTMNSPARDLVSEIEMAASLGMDFVDLTLEPPMASSATIDVKRIRQTLDRHELRVVGHTAYYLPICHPIESVRRGAVDELARCLHVFARLGSEWMNIHPDRHAPFHSRDFIIEQNIRSLRELLPVSEETGVGLMIENIPGDFNDAGQLGELLDPIPSLGLHLDIGHCNLMVRQNTTGEIMERYGNRLRHVHLHDNKGGAADLHMPLGTGTVDVPRHIAMLQDHGYDGTITLEVFTPDRHYVTHSRDLLRRIWEETLEQRQIVSIDKVRT